MEDSCLTDAKPRPVVKASISLGSERRNFVVAQGNLLSEKLVQLKGHCMETLETFLNGAAPEAAMDDPFEEETEDVLDEEEDENPPKKRR